MKPTKVFYELLRAVKDRVPLIGFKGSARSGKTVGIVMGNDFIGNFSSKHKKISVVSQSFPHLRDGFKYEYSQFQAREQIHREHNKSEHEFIVGKSVINYFSLDKDGAKAIGPGRDILYLNEPNRGITFEAYNDLKIRTKDLVIMDWNPSGEWWADEQKIFEEPGARIIHSKWYEDNIENISKNQYEYFMRAKRLSKTVPWWKYWWDVYGEGIDGVPVDERIMPFLFRASKVPDDAIEIPSALDFGWNPSPTAFLRMWIKQTGGLQDELYVQEIVYDTKLNINAIGGNNLTDVLDRKGINKKHLIIAESADQRAVRDLRIAGYNIVRVDKTAVQVSIRHFHDYKIFIVDGVSDSRNKDNTYKEFNNYRYKKNKKGVILDIPDEGQADHSIDACRYVLLSKGKRWVLSKSKQIQALETITAL